MTAQVPYGPPPQEYPQFAAGHAQYPPTREYAPPVSAPPATHRADGYPTVSYPQEGAAGHPEPVPYPPLTIDHRTPGYPQHGEPAGHPEASGLPQHNPQLQPGAGHGYPPAAYPTSPPWAAPDPAAAPSPAPPGTHPSAQSDQPVTAYGGLLVPFPDEMQHASRAQPPAVWPVAIFTLIFGIFGAFSAGRRAATARRGRNSAAPYWITFLFTLAAYAFVWFVLSAVVIMPLVENVIEDQRLTAVQDAVIHDGQLAKANVTATSAQCRPITERNADGMRDYLCRLTLPNGNTASLTLTADPSGNWTSRPAG